MGRNISFCVGGAVLQRAMLVNSVLCREEMLLGRIMEEEEARVEKGGG